MTGNEQAVDLWIKAGCDGLHSSGCPIGQQLFMVMLCKSEPQNLTSIGDEQQKLLQFNVKTSHLHRPHEEFRSLGLRNLPALVHGEITLDHVDEIIEYLDLNFPFPSSNYNNPDADAAVKDVFSKFCFFIKEVNKDPKNMEVELRKIDNFLSKNPYKFLCDDNLSRLDCEILPKLHHIRVACQRLKNYNIPADLRGFWRYMRHAYSSPIFVKSCPCDQEIILHWADRPDTSNLTVMEHKHLSNEKPSFAFDTPE